MPKHPFFLIDAFADRPLSGNPCAVVLDANDLSDSRMQAIATEMNLSETAFVRGSERADFGARFFTPVEEIPLAGHPTLATSWALIESGRLALEGDRTSFELELPAGVIEVEIRSQEGVLLSIVMTQLPPRFLRTYDPALVMPAFGLTPEDLQPGAVVQTVSTGTPQLMVLLRDQDTLRRSRLDLSAYSALKREGDFFSPHLFCLTGFTPDGNTSARHFGVPPDTVEDPFTGSATGGMAAFLWRYGWIEIPEFVAEQGHGMGRPGRASVEVVGPRDNIEAVRVGGKTVTVVRGELLV